MSGALAGASNLLLPGIGPAAYAGIKNDSLGSALKHGAGGAAGLYGGGLAGALLSALIASKLSGGDQKTTTGAAGLGGLAGALAGGYAVPSWMAKRENAKEEGKEEEEVEEEVEENAQAETA